ncbi:MAG: replication initiator protein [Microviridae sp.]|nr:MAG: replication initiator protein [Microviridae sp.]
MQEMQCIRPMPMTVNGERIHVPCNHCNFCLQNRRNEWAYRLTYELKRSQSAKFLTITYNEEHVPKYKDLPVLDKSHLTLLFKTIKQKQKRLLVIQGKQQKLSQVKKNELYDKWKIKYYAVGEYGTQFERPHYHAIVYNLNPFILGKLNIDALWNKGNIHYGDANEKTISYTAKYLIDAQEEEWQKKFRPKPFAIMSKGLGENYIEARKEWHTKDLKFYVNKQGDKVRMPRYYKDRIFNDEQKKEGGAQALAQAEQVQNERIESLILENGGDELKALEQFQAEIEQQHNRIKLKSLKANKL